jgi:hypothetical protein
MNASAQEPAPAPQARTAPATTTAGRTEPAKPGHTVTLDPTHDEHGVDEPGYGHGV